MAKQKAKTKGLLPETKEKRLISWIIIFVFISVLIIWLFSFQNDIQKLVFKQEPVEMSFVFQDESLVEYELFNNQVHGAAEDWSFLFKWDSLNNIYWPYNFAGGHYVADDFSLDNLVIKNIYSNCSAPWWEDIEHWDFVLAYQQRDDNPEFCNIQKRSCDNWKLSGNFSQESCKDISAKYEEVEVVVHNKKVLSPLVAGRKVAITESWNYFKDDLNTVWVNDGEFEKTQEVYVELEDNFKMFCVTEWGEKVNSGQFVKTYKNEYWFTDYPCEVKLVYCNEWSLKWWYDYPSCEYTDQSFQNFYSGWKDKNKPSIQDLIDSLLNEEDEARLDLEIMFNSIK